MAQKSNRHTILFPHEALSLDDLRGAASQSSSDAEINAKYVKGEVRIVTEQARYPLHSIVTMVESGDYQLNPEFQRRHRWNDDKKSRLIESFIMNVPIPPIFLYEDTFSHYEVMDGLQRLTAIYEFYKNRFVLSGLEEWPELRGKTYKTLPEQVKRGVDRRYLSSIILLHETANTQEEAQRLKQLVFERINSGGIKLEPQESRNAIYNGPMNQLCIKLARNRYLCKTWGIPPPTKEELNGGDPSSEVLDNEDYRKMTDVELVLRFFAYRQRLQFHKGPLKSYLDTYQLHGNKFPADTLDCLETLFTRTIKLVYDTFGERAFWLWRVRKNGTWNWYSRATAVVYDPLMYVFSQHLDESDVILESKQKFRDRITDFYEENYHRFEGRMTNLSDLDARNSLFNEFVTEVAGL